MLSNFQLGTHALLQSFLVGQPEFRQMLESPGLNQLRQRVIAACHIGPLSAPETRRYVEHRLQLAGWTDHPLIDDAAYEVVHERSGGIPRRINLLFDRALLAGFLADRRVVTAENLREVAAEIAGETEVAPLLRSTTDAGPEPAAPTQPLADVVPLQPAGRGGWTGELARLEQELRRMQESIARVERGNQAALALFRRLIEQSRPGEPPEALPPAAREGGADA